VPEWVEQLAALGVDASTLPVTDDDIVACFADMWRRQLRPRVIDVAKALGMSRTTMSDRISDLVDQGRIIKVTAGVRVMYVPRIKESAKNGS
jgi:hypothetical protein